MKSSYTDLILIALFTFIIGAMILVGIFFPTKSPLVKRSNPVPPGETYSKIDTQRMLSADSVILRAIEHSEFPGAVLCVVKRADDNSSMGDIIYMKAYGNMQLYSGADSQTGRYDVVEVPMCEDAMFDLASLTKNFGTTLAFMHLLENGKVTLNDRVKNYVPDFKTWDSIAMPETKTKSAKKSKPQVIERRHITIEQLLTHTSGMPASIYVPSFVERCRKNGATTATLSDSLINYLAVSEKRLFRPGSDVRYSCLNYVLLQRIIEITTGESLDEYANRVIFSPLGLSHTRWQPIDTSWPQELSSLLVPTEILPDGTLLKGVVHDPIAREINQGVSGNAGLFSNAHDLAVLSSMIMNRGIVGGVRVLSEASIDAMIRIPEKYQSQHRTLGWDGAYDEGGSYGDLMTPHAVISHTGYTGTSVAIDMERGVAIILLTNRVHPQDKGSIGRTRNVVANIVMSAIN